MGNKMIQQEKLNICTVNWTPNSYKKASQRVVAYNDDYKTSCCVNNLFYSLQKYLQIPFNFICFSDKEGKYLDPDIIQKPMWTEFSDSPLTWRKVKLWSGQMKKDLGDRFCYMDMDWIITGDVTDIFTKPGPVVISKLQEHRAASRRIARKRNDGKMLFHTCFFIKDTEKFQKVWTDLDPWIPYSEVKPDFLKKYDKNMNPSRSADCCWTMYKLHSDIQELNGSVQVLNGDLWGIYSYTYLTKKEKENPPPNARMIAFSGKQHPLVPKTLKKAPWINNYFLTEAPK